MRFIDDQSGNYAASDKQWLSAFYDYEAYIKSTEEQYVRQPSDAKLTKALNAQREIRKVKK